MTRVLIIDDSAAIRQLLNSILSSDPEIEVCGVASDPFVARDKIKALKPDVLTLDVEMPRMDGVTFLEKLMRGHPMPVVMVSSLTERGCEITMRALELGAVDFVSKPKFDTLEGVKESAEEIIQKVKNAAKAKIRKRSPNAAPPKPLSIATRFALTHKVIVIGASTGGTEAIKDVLMGMPANAPGIVVVQHMPPGFTASFAQRMNSLCQIEVKEAEDGDRILPGHALIAPGDFHTSIVRSGAQYLVRVTKEAPVNRHRPSVDVLFDSCAEQIGKNAIGAILTGMGADGASGLKKMRDAGARTIAQDEASCVVFGMPKEAIAKGAAEKVLPLHLITQEILNFKEAA
jgi:two-component system chemotaxis response regulator CheB